MLQKYGLASHVYCPHIYNDQCQQECNVWVMLCPELCQTPAYYDAGLSIPFSLSIWNPQQ